MSIWKFNIDAINRNYPALGKALEELKDDHTVRIEATKIPNNPTAYVKHADGNEWLVHSREDPKKEAYALIDTVLKQHVEFANIVVVLGVGMGYHLEPLFARYSGMNTLFIVVENNVQLFRAFIKNNRPMANVQGQIMSVFDYPGMRLMVGVAPDQVYNYLFELMMKMGRNSHSTFMFVEHPVLIRFNKDYYKPLCQEIARVCYDIRSSYGNDPEDSWIGIDHMLNNLDTITTKPGIIQIKDKFKGVPAVIVATGPSLNKNIDLLPEIKNKAVFFAADASLNTFLLHEPQIIPDIVCSLERNLSTANHFKQIKDKQSMSDIWLCACPVVKPEVYWAWKGKDVTLYRDFAHFTWLGVDRGKLNTGKSVTNMAFKAALYLGCNPIILVGQDLAFAPDGQSHVKGADHARDGLAKSQLIQQKTKVMGNNGTMLESLDTWIGMLKRFEYDIMKEATGVKVINATEGGAKINGTECMTLREVIDTFCKDDHDIADTLNKYLTYPDEQDIKHAEETVNGNIDKGIEYLKMSYRELDDAVETIEEASALVLDGMTDTELNDVIGFCDKVRQVVLGDKMCYLTSMHVIQSWCMGRENIFNTIPNFYTDKEMQIDRFIKLFEFFYGLRKLYKMMIEGVEKDYGDWKNGYAVRAEGVQGVQRAVEHGEPNHVEIPEARLDMPVLQRGAGEVDQAEGDTGSDYQI